MEDIHRKKALPPIQEKLFVCRVGAGSRWLRACAGLGLNISVMAFSLFIPVGIAWGMILVSYALFFEALWGCTMFHSVAKRVTKKDMCCLECSL